MRILSDHKQEGQDRLKTTCTNETSTHQGQIARLAQTSKHTAVQKVCDQVIEKCLPKVEWFEIDDPTPKLSINHNSHHSRTHGRIDQATFIRDTV